MFNLAIKEKNVNEDVYPFKNFKMAKFQKETVKHAISKSDIKKIMEYQTQNFEISFAADIFIFSYLMGGINFVDISYLTINNLEDSKLIYTRRKTGKVIILPVHPKAMDIIEKYHKDEVSYLFPILSNFFGTDQQKTDRIHRVMGKVNKKLKFIGIELGLPIVLTTYVARHTYASVLKKEGVPLSVISESMGHATEKITQTYLERLDYSQLKDAVEKLI